MRRFTAPLLASPLLLALCACSSEDPAPQNPTGGGSGGAAAGSGGASGGSGGASGGTGGASGGSGGAATDPTVPSSTTDVAVWDAWMTAKSYTMNGWVSDVAAPREPIDVTSPHGRVRVWFNPTLVASQKAGNGATLQAPPHTVNSMSVKEFYDAADMLVGTAASLKVDAAAGGSSWVYYCKAPENRCYTEAPAHTTALFGKGDASCAFCHNGFVFAQAP